MTKLEGRWCAFRILAVWLGLIVPSVLLGQHRPGRHEPSVARSRTPVYDVGTETRVAGVVVGVAPGGPATVVQAGAPDTQIKLLVDTSALNVVLAPPGFLADRSGQFRNGDTLDVIGSRVESGASTVILAREVRRRSLKRQLPAASVVTGMATRTSRIARRASGRRATLGAPV